MHVNKSKEKVGMYIRQLGQPPTHGNKGGAGGVPTAERLRGRIPDSKASPTDPVIEVEGRGQ